MGRRREPSRRCGCSTRQGERRADPAPARRRAGWPGGSLINRGPVMGGHAILHGAAELAVERAGRRRGRDRDARRRRDRLLPRVQDVPAFAAIARRIAEILPASASPATRISVRRPSPGSSGSSAAMPPPARTFAARGGGDRRLASASCSMIPRCSTGWRWARCSCVRSQVGTQTPGARSTRARERGGNRSLAMMLGLCGPRPGGQRPLAARRGDLPRGDHAVTRERPAHLPRMALVRAGVAAGAAGPRAGMPGATPPRRWRSPSELRRAAARSCGR